MGPIERTVRVAQRLRPREVGAMLLAEAAILLLRLGAIALLAAPVLIALALLLG